MAEIKILPIRDLDDSFQIRPEGTNSDKVQQYAEVFREHHGWGPFPPLTVVSITDDDAFPPGLYIADGIHRYRAALLANVGIQEVKCEVWEGKRNLLYEKSLAVNAFQGLSMSREDLKAARERIIKDLWPTRQYTPAQLAEICQCSHETIRSYIKRLTEAGRVPVVESIIGADGKERPTQYQPTFKNLKVEKPPQTGPARPTVPTDGAQNNEVPCHFCAGGCGTPIWEEMKNAPDSTYFHIQKNGMTLWFCSEECYRNSWHCPDDDEEDEDESNTVKCERCGKTADFNFAMDFHKSGWRSLDAYYEKWLCPDCKTTAEAKPQPEPEQEPPARVPAPSSCQASGAKSEQEPTEDEEPEPAEFTFTDVDEDALPVCTDEKKESKRCRLRVICDVESEIEDPAEVLRQLGLHSPFTFNAAYLPSITVTLAGLYENINQESLNNNININPAAFTEFYVCCKGKKGPCKVFISRKKYDEWKGKFGPTFDLDVNLAECCEYYNELSGSEMLSAGGVYSKVFAWLLKNWKQQQKQSKPKQNAYKDAGLRFDPSRY